MTNVGGAVEKPMDNEQVKGKQVAGGSSRMLVNNKVVRSMLT
jgi:hypothetical protein